MHVKTLNTTLELQPIIKTLLTLFWPLSNVRSNATSIQKVPDRMHERLQTQTILP
jgi:hypothetical protein